MKRKIVPYTRRMYMPGRPEKQTGRRISCPLSPDPSRLLFLGLGLVSWVGYRPGVSPFSAVFLPGTLCDERVFLQQRGLFEESEVVDLRSPTSMEAMIQAVGRVSFERFVLIGFSMGGHIAQEFALRYPERLDGLIVLGASSEGYPMDEKHKVMASLPLIERGQFHGITDRRLREFIHPDAYEDAVLRHLIQDMAGVDAKEVYLRQVRATLERRNLTQDMRSIHCPVLFIGGLDDEIVPIGSIKRSAENIDGARFAALERCGHFVTLERPEAVNQEIKTFSNSPA